MFPTMKTIGSSEGQKKAETQSEEKATEAPAEIDFSKVKIEPLFEEMVDFNTFSKSDFRAVKIKECETVLKSKKLLKSVLDDGSGTERVILSGIHEYYEPEELVGKILYFPSLSRMKVRISEMERLVIDGYIECIEEANQRCIELGFYQESGILL